LAWPASRAAAQGVTTGSITGVVLDAQGQALPGATVVAVHEPSGTQYQTVSRADGGFSIPSMRIGGPYKVTASLGGFEPQAQEGLTITIGAAVDLSFTLRIATVTEAVTVTATADPVFSSSRTGAGTSVGRVEIATLPTVTGRIGDIARLTPQSSGMSFAGQDNRLNNIAVDGAYFNNSFGLGGQPGDRTNVAPISLESIEQIQVDVAPFDVRQGNFVGANINTVTRSGTNAFTGSIYHRFRNDSFVGTEAKGQAFNPGKFNTKQTGGWAGGPVVRNKLFFFANFENETDVRPLTTFRANSGGQPAVGNTTRVLASDLDTLSQYLKQNFNYDTGPYQDIDDDTPQKRFLAKADYNLGSSNKISFRYSQLNSSSFNNLSGSSSAGFGRRTFSTDFLNYQASDYTILENIKSGIGEWNSVLKDTLANTFLIGYTTNDESRNVLDNLFPFVDIQDGNGVAYTSFGSEPFTPDNILKYHTFQVKDDITKFVGKHTFTLGATYQKYRSFNVFFNCCKQGVYVYDTLQDFYADANDYLAHPNRTTSPVTLKRYSVRYMNIPGLDRPEQILKVQYGGGYAQDEWRPTRNLTIMGGVRLDMSAFGNTGYDNPNADALTFRDEDGSAVQYNSGKLPDTQYMWSPRVGFNWNAIGDRRLQIRGGTGVFTGQPLYVWISNQIGQTGMLQGNVVVDNTTARPFTTDVNAYKPTNITGAPAASYELDVTDHDFKFPQIWRSNIAVDHRMPGDVVASAELVYNRDVNGIYYINANLPAAQSAYTGVDSRPRWTGASCGSGTSGPCVTRINNAPGNQVTSTIVMKNESLGRAWTASIALSKNYYHGLTMKGAYSYGEAKNTIDPGSTAFASWGTNAQSGDPNNPGLAFSTQSPGHRVYLQMSYSKQYLRWGATTISAFWEARTAGNGSYVFAGDANGDAASSGNDLIYIPRDQSEMNFVPFSISSDGAVVASFTAAQQAQAFDDYINQDAYLSQHRGEYAQRNAVFFPMIKRLDLSLNQQVFHDIGGKKNTGELRIDILNFSNMLNHNWGVSQRLVQPQLLTNAAADAQGRLSYRMNTASGQLLSKSFQTNAALADVYSFMLSFRYTFN
jgi:hypothetical protein